MYIKNKEIKDNCIKFETSPVYDTHRLVNRARAIVDDYFTFVNFEWLSENYNFRKYCIEPIFETTDGNRRMRGVRISELVFYDSEFTIDVLKNGEIYIYYPDKMTNESRTIFESRCERLVSYVFIS